MSSLARASGKDEDAGVGDGDWVGVDEGLMAETMMRRTPAPRASRAVAARGGRSRGGALEQLATGAEGVRIVVATCGCGLQPSFLSCRSSFYTHRAQSYVPPNTARERREHRDNGHLYSDRYMYAPSIFTIYLLAFHPDRALTELHLLKARQYSTGPCPCGSASRIIIPLSMMRMFMHM